MNRKKSPRVWMLKTRFTNTSPNSIVSDIEKTLKTKGKKTIFYANAHSINLARKDSEYQKILNTADFLFPDGIGIAWAAGIFGKPITQKITLMDFIDELLLMIIKNNWSLYLVGGSKDVCKNTILNFKKNYPKLKIAGFQDGFFETEEEVGVIKNINRNKPDVLFVAMGVPKQEKWIIKNLPSLKAKAFFAIGGSIDHLAGTIPRAPYFMHRHGFEWVYRFLKEPRRLWRRYIIGNPVFLYRVFKSKFKGT